MKHEAVGHHKMFTLAETLDIQIYSAHGIMEMLWHHVGDQCIEGNIGKLSNAAIARGVGWEKKPEDLIAALVSTGFIDQSDEYRLIVHDWPDHAQEWIKKKLKRMGKDYLSVYGKSVHDRDLGPRIQPVLPVSSHSLASVSTYSTIRGGVKGGKVMGGNGISGTRKLSEAKLASHENNLAQEELLKACERNGFGLRHGDPDFQQKIFSLTESIGAPADLSAEILAEISRNGKSRIEGANNSEAYFLGAFRSELEKRMGVK